MLHYKAVSPDLLTILQALMKHPLLHAFRLVGGTSLALQSGHRTSVDIDLFTDTPFDNRSVQQALHESFGSFQLLWQNDNGFSASINDVKLDIFNWRVRFIYPAVEEDDLRMMAQREIGAMKLEAITDRKTQKDFADIYFLLQTFSLSELIESFRIKYPFIDYKFVLESLSLIDEADNSEPPRMLQDFSWIEAKNFVVAACKNYWKDLDAKAAAQQQDRLKNAEDLLRKKKNN